MVSTLAGESGGRKRRSAAANAANNDQTNGGNDAATEHDPDMSGEEEEDDVDMAEDVDLISETGTSDSQSVSSLIKYITFTKPFYIGYFYSLAHASKNI